ncbi:MAG: hypothetical protein A2934_00785 [Candidatus Sungbacteria bacterium RIFCSPLOWO2_01_FULL_47_10]|uniref:Uncharacterized protein n=1 Tax=Candidatus Sungbacteria bacterium RIFCSPLOWO2_01_FULL_47_10 TaxID=1802276 RepID=A0A1G2KYE8_9BACT|nr:MAG: hypothetical protein A2934_00785 [Candidatus Sungbacteria bacterium RIFCSPLOWO2_01_FULL_47_10]
MLDTVSFQLRLVVKALYIMYHESFYPSNRCQKTLPSTASCVFAESQQPFLTLCGLLVQYGYA